MHTSIREFDKKIRNFLNFVFIQIPKLKIGTVLHMRQIRRWRIFVFVIEWIRIRPDSGRNLTMIWPWIVPSIYINTWQTLRDVGYTGCFCNKEFYHNSYTINAVLENFTQLWCNRTDFNEKTNCCRDHIHWKLYVRPLELVWFFQKPISLHIPFEKCVFLMKMTRDLIFVKIL